jgi:hypothetical protein
VPIIAALRQAGATSLRAIADGLNAQAIPTARGSGEWSPTQVARVIERLRHRPTLIGRRQFLPYHPQILYGALVQPPIATRITTARGPNGPVEA